MGKLLFRKEIYLSSFISMKHNCFLGAFFYPVGFFHCVLFKIKACTDFDLKEERGRETS